MRLWSPIRAWIKGVIRSGRLSNKEGKRKKKGKSDHGIPSRIQWGEELN
jgi:hypothetical protein